MKRLKAPLEHLLQNCGHLPSELRPQRIALVSTLDLRHTLRLSGHRLRLPHHLSDIVSPAIENTNFYCNLAVTLLLSDSKTSHRQTSHLLDPLGCHAALISQFNLHETKVIAPNICDGNGKLILPEEYGTKLHTGDVVIVEAHLKL